ncbi:hypothetical protein HUJ05_006600 [Dendroctonus ponderosae]|nr:hypothetical protein HUJ05_006600 [Dendroctonus ponderosae]
MEKSKIHCLRITIVFLIYVVLNLSISYAFNYMGPTYEKWNPARNKTFVYRDYPYPLWYPFDTSISDGYYLLGFFYQPYAFFFIMAAFLSIEDLSVAAIIHLTTHIKILGYAFGYVDHNINPMLEHHEIIELKQQRIIKLINDLKEIYKCAEILNSYLSDQLLIQEFLMSIVICCSVYRVTVVTSSTEMSYLSTMAVIIGADMFIVSWYNQGFTLESFKDTTIVVEDGDSLLTDIHERISNMMKQKVEAVRRIMDIAEQAAKAQKEDDININFQFYNAKNLTNSAQNITGSDENELNDLASSQDIRYDDSLLGSLQIEQSYHQKMPPEGVEIYQRDQSPLDNRDIIYETDIEITEDVEKHPQASQTQPVDKTMLPLYKNKHFYNIPVNINNSAVHVPSNVYERSKDVISGIMWSEELDKTFRNNYKLDPTLSWQYFGSSTGFMRQFPAMIWSQQPVDLFDCRTRSWYIEAASSPKDILILVDRSGSMTGMRREIARHVVHNILDTLGNNDYVNIYTFSNTTDPLIECFSGKLVQANLGNIRILKESMSDFKTEQIANFTLALATAFEILAEYRESKLGANCNQAIMLITDGSQDNYKDVFEKYNWDNLPVVTVRLFTYLVGREVSDPRDVKWMACANQGYYVHLSTYAEVREEVLHYIPVMARPMVLNANQKPNPAWSPVYADVTDPKLTNWLWVNRQRFTQRDRYLIFSKYKDLMSPNEIDKKFVHQQKLANLGNIRILKESMSDFKTEQIANFTLALATAFEILAEYRESKLGANCNQAIMLITDGSQDNYKDVFEKYNWDNLPVVTVRLFTYLVGREVSDPRDVKWMACANQGYYVHLSTYAEVREEVLHYIPVMARPMVLNANQKPNPAWSPVYADVTDPKLTNWLWVNRQRFTQRDRYLIFSKYKDLMSPNEIDKKFVHQQKLVSLRSFCCLKEFESKYI